MLPFLFAGIALVVFRAVWPAEQILQSSDFNIGVISIYKRIFPAVNMDRSGTRKEELLYHPDELQRIFSMRRSMQGLPGTEAMEMVISRLKKTKSNVEFLMGLNR